MFSRKAVLISLLVAVLAAAGCTSILSPGGECASPNCWMAEHGGVRLRLRETPTSLAQYNYTVEVGNDQDEWRVLHLHKQNEPLEEAQKHIRAITDKTALFFLGSVCGVTNDGGTNWSIVDLQLDTNYGRQNPESVWIESVEIDPNGRGKAMLVNREGEQAPVSFLTDDFGQSWQQLEEKQREWLSYAAAVELKGKLGIETFFGPPNFGENPETDSKESVWILHLDEAINVKSRSNSDAPYERDSFKEVRKLQLVLPNPRRELIGTRVTAVGTLFQAHTGHHHTDVLMEIRTIHTSKNRERPF